MSTVDITPPVGPVNPDCPVIAIDSEYVVSSSGISNQVLCYSYAIGDGQRYVTGICNTEDHSKKGRFTLEKLLKIAISHGLKVGIFDSWPQEMILGAHFLRADISSFANGVSPFMEKLLAIRKTVVTKRAALNFELEQPEDESLVNVYDDNRHVHKIKIHLYDSMLFAPSGKGLADIGKLIGVPKMGIPVPYSIERMDEFMQEQPELFRQYAINDAEICYLFIVQTSEFVATEFGMTKLPKTLGGMALNSYLASIGDNYLPYFGLQQTTKEIFNKETGGVRVIKAIEPTAESEVMYSFATSCYHGGRNESFMVGPTDRSIWYDFDVSSCYTTAATMIKPLNYAALRQVFTPEDFFNGVFGLAYVNFSFPPETRFPCLPVRTEAFGLVYPLSGKSHCTAPEIELAVKMGAMVEIVFGFVIPWEDEGDVFQTFMRKVKVKRLSYPKGSFHERMWKEIGNSLYGKLAQGLSGKTAFDIANGINSEIPASQITNPYYAAFITGFCRALLSEMLSSVPSNRTLVSVTTDGFLTDATLDEIDLTGQLCQRFDAAYKAINPDDGAILEVKHAVRQLIAIKTRGQLTFEGLEGHQPVLARAGVQVPFGVDANQYMVDLYLKRKPGQLTSRMTLTTIRAQSLYGGDMVAEKTEIRLGLEPDYKRRWVNPRMVQVGNVQHIALDSEPFDNVDDSIHLRRAFDVWRQNHCLKTLADWDDWQNFYPIYRAKSGKNIRITLNDRADTLFARLFLRVYAQEALGVSRNMTNANFAAYMTGLGYATKPSAVGSAKRAKLITGAIPVTPSSVNLLQKLLEHYPEFQYLEFFVPGSEAALTSLIV